MKAAEQTADDTEADPAAEPARATTPAAHAPEPELDLDATTQPEPALIEAAWKATIEERKGLEAETAAVARTERGTPPPAAVVRSAEGYVLFQGLRISGNGELSRVARAALRDNFPRGDELKDEQHS